MNSGEVNTVGREGKGGTRTSNNNNNNNNNKKMI